MSTPRKETKTDSVSKVAERLTWLEGQSVTVRVCYAEIGQLGGEVFDAIYRDTLPLGREYFFVFEVDGLSRLVRTPSVVEVRER